MGTLIAPNLVLTCAHNIYFIPDTVGTRVTAKDVWVDLGDRKIKVKDFRFPEEFIKRSSQREFDFALLLL